MAEVYCILYRLNPSQADEACCALSHIGMSILPVENDGLWRTAAKIKAQHSLSLADAFAVATAEKHAHETAEQIVMRFGRFGTIDLRVDYLHQGIGRSFHAGAKVVRLGGRIASVQMELKNDADLLIATGTAAYIIS